ncbi:MAG TPA: hypothetical protein DEG17_22865 [Cyanobacteria bacterium UBA11149]|nr:hypothetical protein [Cyanobacteria bacterium UBA11367]HBE60280.1 hypothetical protein [Cyanobacteria bacterium UBA11366]HBK62097.1 hypothetical protein [Cyanobacteria bacterium UBA11166]HBR74221.1 hypothetical protein [Cyanobacteria bacterium UBA11159]HBS70233.1 hypothetical protein [Cyanobacteria bacterium UBA11153]HBW91625.1 hypothetical protein [Cyanobacteria bacterium UBA11149]HCA93469.1 hypothetical protein [Cyanobacteria bacterium UBA9226]
MPYSEFSLKKVKKDFDLNILEVPTFISDIVPVKPSDSLAQFLEKYLPLALALNTEKARSEMIICPILLEIKEIFDRKISLFSGNDFTVDQSLGLNGVCDFLISKSPEQLFIEAPAVIVVEAKKEDLNGGLGQCVAEMVAAGRFNQKDGNFGNPIYGCVTTGNLWKFMKLEEQTVTIGLREYTLPPIEDILGILVSFISE